jgi:hypothetical protein
MSLIGAVMDKVMKRGLYRAYDGNRLISMCQDCKNNAYEPGFFKSVPVHRCLSEWTLDGKNRVIIDPYNVPTWCPCKIEEIPEGVKAQ